MGGEEKEKENKDFHSADHSMAEKMEMARHEFAILGPQGRLETDIHLKDAQRAWVPAMRYAVCGCALVPW